MQPAVWCDAGCGVASNQGDTVWSRRRVASGHCVPSLPTLTTLRAVDRQCCIGIGSAGPLPHAPAVWCSLSNSHALVCRRTATRSHATLQEVSRLSQPLQHRRTAPHTLARVLGLKCTPHWARARAQVHARARRCHASKRACQRFPAHASKTAQASVSQRMPAGSTVHASTT